MKKANYLLYAFFLIFVIGGVACYLLFVDDGVPNVDEGKKDNYKFSVEYTKVPMDNVFNYKTEDEIIEILEKKIKTIVIDSIIELVITDINFDSSV